MMTKINRNKSARTSLSKSAKIKAKEECYHKERVVLIIMLSLSMLFFLAVNPELEQEDIISSADYLGTFILRDNQLTGAVISQLDNYPGSLSASDDPDTFQNQNLDELSYLALFFSLIFFFTVITNNYKKIKKRVYNPRNNFIRKYR
jgi:hypothetical protein